MKTRIASVIALWIVSVCVGVVAMVRYQITPGSAATPPRQYPATMKSSRGELLLFIHPQCPCTTATVRELGRIEAATGAALEIKIYFYRPSSESDSWCRESAPWHEATLIPGAHLTIDPDGKVAKRFGARCSGQVLVYDSKNGQLVFSGGITPERGHEGESVGEDAILAYAHTGTCPVSQSEVFGCAIWSDAGDVSSVRPSRGGSPVSARGQS